MKRAAEKKMIDSNAIENMKPKAKMNNRMFKQKSLLSRVLSI